MSSFKSDLLFSTKMPPANSTQENILKIHSIEYLKTTLLMKQTHSVSGVNHRLSYYLIRKEITLISQFLKSIFRYVHIHISTATAFINSLLFYFSLDHKVIK